MNNFFFNLIWIIFFMFESLNAYDINVNVLHTKSKVSVNKMLDKWMDDKWSNQSPQSLINIINEADLNIRDIEKMLLNGRSIYPDPSDKLGEIVKGKPINAEHVDTYLSEYLIYVPTSYDKSIQTSLIIYGHGGSSCQSLSKGSNNASYAMNLWKDYAEQRNSILIAPLTGRGWGLLGYSVLFSTLSEVQRNYNINPNRIYLTGHSMGGHLTYRSGIYLGDRWAAISPMSGGYDYVQTNLVENLFNIPGIATWGENDKYGIEEHNRKIKDWMEEHYYPWKNLEKPGGGHEIFPEYIDDVELLFDQSKRNLYRKKVFASAGSWDAPGGLNLSNLKIDRTFPHNDCNQVYIWKENRPIPASTFSWLELSPADNENTVQRVWAVNKGNNLFEITSENIRKLRVYFHPNMVDFEKPIVIKVNGEIVHKNLVKPNLATMLNLVRKYDDRGRIFYAEVTLNIDTDNTPPSPSGILTRIQSNYGEEKSDWSIYDVSPSGASISNIEENGNRVIQLQGDGINNGYMVGDWSGGANVWNNRRARTIQWRMKYDEDFVVYVSVDTQKGHRFLYYDNREADGGWISDVISGHDIDSRYVHHGLGTKASDSSWRTFTRDLEEDLKEVEPDNIIISVNAFHIRGSGLVDDIALLEKSIYEDAEDINTKGWRVYDKTPAGATISNVEDNGDRVIELQGDGTKNGYILGDWIGGTNVWNNRTEKTIRWRMKYDEDFVVYVNVETEKGERYLYYTNSNNNDGQWRNYIHHGLGLSASNGTWQTFNRDLESDLKDLESDNSIVAVNAFLIRGSGLVDDIEMVQNYNPVELNISAFYIGMFGERSISHDIYIPSNVTHLEFDMKRVNRDCSNDRLEILIDGHGLKQYSMCGLDRNYVHREVEIPVDLRNGVYATLTFRIIDLEGSRVNSALRIKNVSLKK